MNNVTFAAAQARLAEETAHQATVMRETGETIAASNEQLTAALNRLESAVSAGLRGTGAPVLDARSAGGAGGCHDPNDGWGLSLRRGDPRRPSGPNSRPT